MSHKTAGYAFADVPQFSTCNSTCCLLFQIVLYITLLESPAFHCLDPFNSVPKVSGSSSVVIFLTKDNE